MGLIHFGAALWGGLGVGGACFGWLSIYLISWPEQWSSFLRNPLSNASGFLCCAPSIATGGGEPRRHRRSSQYDPPLFTQGAQSPFCHRRMTVATITIKHLTHKWGVLPMLWPYFFLIVTTQQALWCHGLKGTSIQNGALGACLRFALRLKAALLNVYIVSTKPRVEQVHSDRKPVSICAPFSFWTRALLYKRKG